MRSLLTIARFELGGLLKSPTIYVYLLIFIGLGVGVVGQGKRMKIIEQGF